MSRFGYHPEVGQYKFVRYTAVMLMLIRIHLFQVDQEQLAVIHHLPYDLGPGKQSRIDSPVDALFATTAQQFEEWLRMQQRFPGAGYLIWCSAFIFIPAKPVFLRKLN